MKVRDRFLSIQGTGHLVGLPQFFVRLAGCSVVDCHLRDVCDEPEALTPKGSFDLTPDGIVNEAHVEVGPFGWVHITGGEPMDQEQELAELVSIAQARGLKVHLQTSGSRPVGIPWDWITVSPKLGEVPKQPFGQEVVYVVRDAGPKTEQLLHRIKAETSFFYYYLMPLSGEDAAPVVELVHRMNFADRWAAPHHNGNKFLLTSQAHKHWGIK